MSTAVSKRKRNSDSLAAPDHKLCKVTQTSMASFLTTSSEKETGKIAWQERGQGGSQPNTLLVGTYVPLGDQSTGTKKRRTKVAAFDFDSTLIITKSGKVHASNAQDWKWWHPSVPEKLKKLYRHDGSFSISIISNQAGLSIKSDSAPKSKLSLFKMKVSDVLGHLDIPITIYAATEKDLYRKPRTGIWLELLKDFDFNDSTGNLNLEESIFVGDAAGRQSSNKRPKDFSCSDRNFAENVGIKFATPEEYFLGEKQRPFLRNFEPSTYFQDTESQVTKVFTRINKQDIILLCGSPGAGKSSWYWKNLEPLGYVRVNQDILKTASHP
ncbi:Bifunctional polynucleotide phosphatase/kinase [Erysiphe neolycopersici]|uniref:Bifunctional polynucleotide phosphatase/kinase n=1 Tax=Erysiphe neolycopersici TaxID=212602 RepID=A0A420H928_9PEZI|nr:Bifunctional polynucleotide phosphatase/kinase [Erysiphe neolycopersici]